MTADSTPFFGPMFPDWASAPIVTPGVQAYLRLEDPVLVGPAFQLVTLRARVVGVAGNEIEIKFRDDGESETGFVDENTTTKKVELRFMGGVTTAADMFTQINTNSTLIEAVGTYDTFTFQNGDDETYNFSPLTDGWIPLNNGAAGVSTLCRFWGPHFPDGPDADPPRVDPNSPPAAATFVLALENGVRFALSWATDVYKNYDGTEIRASLLDDPRQSYMGRALLLGDAVRQVRTQLSRYAALGRPFLLGLPYEETTLSADASGLVYPLADPTADLDWAVPGQRVLVVAGDGSGFDAVIQAVDTDSITLDTGPGIIGVEGARVMPGMPVLFDPQQGFRRKRTADGADFWEISGRASLYGFPASAVPGELQLGDVTSSGTFANAFLRARVAGDQSVQVSIEADSLSGVTLDESFNSVDGSGELIIHVEDNGTTMAELAAAINGVSQLVYMLGDWTDTDVIATGDDEFIPTALTGGLAAAPGEMGRGATVLTLDTDNRPIWDRGIANHDTIGDSMQAMTETIDLGGIPIQIGCAEVPDWGRQVSIEDDRFSEWQWLKAFLAAVRGRWKSWWLPTGRADLESTADATATTVTIAADVGDFDLWSSRDYAVLRIEQDGGTRYVTITDATTSGDDIVLTVTGDALDAAPVSLISWCELCRFESDDFEIQFGADGFSMAAQARVIRNVDDA